MNDLVQLMPLLGLLGLEIRKQVSTGSAWAAGDTGSNAHRNDVYWPGSTGAQNPFAARNGSAGSNAIGNAAGNPGRVEMTVWE